MSAASVFGAVAVVLTTAGWVPQIRRALRSRSVADFSLSWLVLFGSGVTCWLVYGLLKHDPAIIVANTMAVLAILTLVAIHRQSRLAEGDEPAPVDGPVTADLLVADEDLAAP